MFSYPFLRLHGARRLIALVEGKGKWKVTESLGKWGGECVAIRQKGSVRARWMVDVSATSEERWPNDGYDALFSEWLTYVRYGKLTALTPVVDHVGIGPIEPFRMRALHGHTLHGHAVPVGAQAPVGIFASQVHASLYRRSPRRCKRFASIQQLVETFTGSGTTTGRTKLDVTSCLATLRSRSVQANCKSIKNAASVCQYDVAGALHKHGPDLTSQIESPIDLVGEFPAGMDGLFALPFGKGR
jgi:hypothetical protein